MSYIEMFRRYKKIQKERRKLCKRYKAIKDKQSYTALDVVKGSSTDAPYLERQITIEGRADNSAKITAIELDILKIDRELDKLIPPLRDIDASLDENDYKEDEIKCTLELYYNAFVTLKELAYYLGYDTGDGTTQLKAAHRYLTALEAADKEKGIRRGEGKQWRMN